MVYYLLFILCALICNSSFAMASDSPRSVTRFWDEQDDARDGAFRGISYRVWLPQMPAVSAGQQADRNRIIYFRRLAALINVDNLTAENVVEVMTLLRCIVASSRLRPLSAHEARVFEIAYRRMFR